MTQWFDNNVGSCESYLYILALAGPRIKGESLQGPAVEDGNYIHPNVNNDFSLNNTHKYQNIYLIWVA